MTTTTRKPATPLPCNLETLRNPEMVKRWFDQIGTDAADEIDRLRADRARLIAALRECKNYIEHIEKPRAGTSAVTYRQQAAALNTARALLRELGEL